jgi:hypothetical protein
VIDLLALTVCHIKTNRRHYEPTTTQVEEEQNPSQEVGHSLRKTQKGQESDALRGKGPQQEEHAMGSSATGPRARRRARNRA